MRDSGLRGMTSPESVVPLQQDRAHSARMSNYYLGGRTNYAVDRDAADEVIRVFPAMKMVTRVNQAFLVRSARFLARRQGIRQFLQIGAGIPTEGRLHDAVRRVVPHTRFVYVDNDPIVLLYGESALSSLSLRTTRYIAADATDPEAILEAVERAECLDLRQPIGVSLISVLHFMPDDRDPYGFVRSLVRNLPRGSFLTLSHWTRDFDPSAWAAVADIYTRSGTAVQVRSRQEVLRFVEDLELVDPGLVVAHRWRPEPGSGPSLISDAQASLYGVAARLPG